MLLYTAIISALLVVGFNILFLDSIQAKVDLDKEERDFIKQLNDYRKKNGLNKLKISSDLSRAALAMAEDMSDHPDLINHEHEDSKGRLPSERAAIYGYNDGVGENLAAGYETADKVFKAWKGSTVHQENMVDRDYEVIGVARVVTSNNYKWYWVNMFGDTEHKSDLVDEEDYAPMVKVRVVVIDENGKVVKKPKITILTKNKHKITSAKGSNKGKKNFSIAPSEEFYVKADATNYSSYTKKVKLGTKKDITVKMWLEKS